MEDHILIESVRPWRALYFDITPPLPPPFPSLVKEYPKRIMREWGRCFLPKYNTQFKNPRGILAKIQIKNTKYPTLYVG